MQAAGTLATTLRDLRHRRGLTQKQLAELANSGESHLCRIERGERELSDDLLARLSHALDDKFELAAAAGRLPEGAEESILGFPRALVEPQLGDRTVPALRSITAADIAMGLLKHHPDAQSGGRVDPAYICKAMGIRIAFEIGSNQAPVDFSLGPERRQVTIRAGREPGEDGLMQRQRFLVAHAAAHAAAGSRECSLPTRTAIEVDLLDVGGYLLSPPSLVRSSLASISAEMTVDYWGLEVARIIYRVAQKLGIPEWLATQRLAEDELLKLAAISTLTGGTR